MDATTVGVDLAKNIFVACVADCAGRIVERREFNRAGFLSRLGTLPAGTVIGMEACGCSHHWGRTAQHLGLAPRRMVASAPEIATGEAAEHRRLARLAAFSLQRAEDLLDRVGHVYTGMAGPPSTSDTEQPFPGVSCKSTRYSEGNWGFAREKIQSATLAASPSTKPCNS